MIPAGASDLWQVSRFVTRAIARVRNDKVLARWPARNHIVGNREEWRIWVFVLAI